MWSQSGIGTYIRNFAKFVAPSIDGVEWTFLVRDEDLNEVMGLPFRSNAIAANSKIYSFGEQIELFKKIPKDAELFWSPHWNVSLFSPVPSLVTVHDLFHQKRKEGFASLKQSLGAKPYFLALKMRSARILTVSEFSGSQLKEAGFKRVQVIQNFVGDDWKKIGPINSVARPYFVFVSNLKPHKNLKVVLEGFREFSAQHLQYDFFIVGQKDGLITKDDHVLQLARAMAPKVKVLGKISFNELRQLVDGATAMICPSKYEGFGLTVAEAMKAEVPIIASSIPAHREVGGDVPVYFDPDSKEDCQRAMEFVAFETSGRALRIRRGLERVELFSVNSIRPQYQTYFAKLIEDSRSRSNRV